MALVIEPQAAKMRRGNLPHGTKGCVIQPKDFEDE